MKEYKINCKLFGFILILIGGAVNFHWYFAHYLNNQLVPELLASIIALYISGILIISKKLTIK